MTDVAPHVDLLTGAFKRAHLEELLIRAVAESKRAGQPLALIHLDVDELQELNDLHGRDSLDTALGWLASKVSEVCDGAGAIGRVGDDELAVVLKGVTLERALRIAEKIRKAVPLTLHASAFGDYRLTVSVGVAAMRPGEPSGNLLDAAEEACIRAKQGGRDSVVGR
jgi:diguanylate cyclase (GGDEF)-like protein